MKSGMDKRVLVAMSGGVDSSVCASLLLDEGCEVAGVTFALASGGICGSTPEAEDAARVCALLGIPHDFFNRTQLFERTVVERFCSAYLEGRTPNPCIDCNLHVKFAEMHALRERRGYTHIATGHYARIAFDAQAGRYLLLKGLDPSKDQSYVLFNLTQDQLAHTLFPLGVLTKKEVRAIAQGKAFVNAQKAESQDICFIPDGNYARFIEERTGHGFDPGDIVARDGSVLGHHNGLINYTVGQRKGIGVAAPEPLYVFAKDAQLNQLIVGTDAETRCTGIEADHANFIAVPAIEGTLHATVKTHYRQTPQPCTVEQTGPASLRIEFDEPLRACALGQAAVVYDGESVVCGGTIAACV